MALTETRPDTGADATSVGEQAGPGPLELLLGSGDHLTVGRTFIGGSLMFLVLALVGRILVGIDLVGSDGLLGSLRTLTDLSSLVALLLLGVVPLLLGLGLAVVPLQVGSPAVAFPRAAALSLWTWVLSGGVYLTSVVLNGGTGGGNDAAARLGNVATGGLLVALGLGTVCVMTTVVAHRPLGMGLARVPLFSWSMLVGGAIWVLSFGSAFAHVLVGQITHAGAAGLLTNFSAGLAWLVRGPSIYMVAVPVLGIAGDLVARTAGRRLANYFVFQTLIGAFAVLSFGAWAQLPASVQTAVWSLIALLVALPVLGLLGGLGDALRRGPVTARPELVGSLLSLLLLLGGAAAGALQVLDNAGHGQLIGLRTSSLVLAQVLFVVGAALTGAVAGLLGWAPQLWGRSAEGGAPLGAVGLVVLGTALAATAALVQGLVQIDGKDTATAAFGVAVALGSAVVLLGVVTTLAAVLGAARRGADDGAEDLTGPTLEWAGAPRALDADPVRSPYPLLDDAEDKENA